MLSIESASLRRYRPGGTKTTRPDGERGAESRCVICNAVTDSAEGSHVVCYGSERERDAPLAIPDARDIRQAPGGIPELALNTP